MEWVNEYGVTLAVDASGHEHDEKGRFGKGGSKKSNTNTGTLLDTVPVGMVIMQQRGGFGGADHYLRAHDGWRKVNITNLRGQFHGDVGELEDADKLTSRIDQTGMVVPGIEDGKIAHPVHLEALPVGTKLTHATYPGNVWEKTKEGWIRPDEEGVLKSEHFAQSIINGEGYRIVEPEKALSTDASGHEHKGKGKGGGQFVSNNNEDTFKVKPPKKLYRGVMKSGKGAGTFSLGKGLYSTPTKKFLSGFAYDNIVELTPEEAFPRNPLVLRTPSDFTDWLLRESGSKNIREFNAKYPDPGSFVKSKGYDGVWAGDEVVKYSNETDDKAMSITDPSLWACEVQRRCLLEADGDILNGLAAAGYILANYSPETFPIALSTDASGHEHKGKGEGGGQFVGKGSNSDEHTSVISKIKDIVELMANNFEQVNGWKEGMTREGFIKNWNKNLKGSEAPSDAIARINSEVSKAREKYNLPNIPIVVRKHADYDAGKGDAYGRWNRGHIIIYPDTALLKNGALQSLSKERAVSPTNSYEDQIGGVVVHEYGHAFHDSEPGVLDRAKSVLTEKPDIIAKYLGRYATTAPEETAAEAFTVYKHPDFSSLPDEAQKLVKYILGENVDKWSTSKPILSNDKQLSIDAFFAHDIHNRHAQGVLNRALKAVRGMSASARRDLNAALNKTGNEGGTAILEFVNKYRLHLANLLTTTQLAAILEGAQEVANKVPPLGEVPVEGLSVAEQEAILKAGKPAKFEIPESTIENVHLHTIQAATKNLAERKVMDRQSYDMLEAAARAKAFTVANVAAEETLTKIRDSLAENVREGADHATWSKKILEDVGQGTFISDAHQETVFRTNVQTAFSDGQATVLSHPLVRSGFPYSTYDAIHDDRVRENHIALETLGIDGTNYYRNDDPVFQTFRPPWDYNDRCGWTPKTVRQAAEAGIPEAVEWLKTGIEPATKAFVEMPEFRPPEGFQRAISAAPLSIQLSLQSIAVFSHEYKRDNAGRFASTGSTVIADEPSKGKTDYVLQAKATVNEFEESLAKLESTTGSEQQNNLPGVRHLRALSSKLGQLTKAFFKGVEKRYGKKIAVATLIAGQAIGWGATGIGAASGIPIWLPGSSLWGGIPVVAVAETFLQLKRAKKAIGLSVEDGNHDELVNRLAHKLMNKLSRATLDYIDDHEDELRGTDLGSAMFAIEEPTQESDLTSSEVDDINRKRAVRINLISRILARLFGDDAEQVTRELVESQDIALAVMNPVLKKRYGKKPGVNWTPGGISANGKQIWLWNPPTSSGAPTASTPTPTPTPPVAPPAPATPPAPTPTPVPAPTPAANTFPFTPVAIPPGHKARAASVTAYNTAMGILSSGQPLSAADKAYLSKHLTNMPTSLLRQLHAALGATNMPMPAKATVAAVRAILTAAAPAVPMPAPTPTPAAPPAPPASATPTAPQPITNIFGPKTMVPHNERTNVMNVLAKIAAGTPITSGDVSAVQAAIGFTTGSEDLNIANAMGIPNANGFNSASLIRAHMQTLLATAQTPTPASTMPGVLPNNIFSINTAVSKTVQANIMRILGVIQSGGQITAADERDVSNVLNDTNGHEDNLIAAAIGANTSGSSVVAGIRARLQQLSAAPAPTTPTPTPTPATASTSATPTAAMLALPPNTHDAASEMRAIAFAVHDGLMTKADASTELQRIGNLHSIADRRMIVDALSGTTGITNAHALMDAIIKNDPGHIGTSPPGPPPRPNLVWNPTTHRWILGSIPTPKPRAARVSRIKISDVYNTANTAVAAHHQANAIRIANKFTRSKSITNRDINQMQMAMLHSNQAEDTALATKMGVMVAGSRNPGGLIMNALRNAQAGVSTPAPTPPPPPPAPAIHPALAKVFAPNSNTSKQYQDVVLRVASEMLAGNKITSSDATDFNNALSYTDAAEDREIATALGVLHTSPTPQGSLVKAIAAAVAGTYMPPIHSPTPAAPVATPTPPTPTPAPTLATPTPTPAVHPALTNLFDPALTIVPAKEQQDLLHVVGKLLTGSQITQAEYDNLEQALKYTNHTEDSAIAAALKITVPTNVFATRVIKSHAQAAITSSVIGQAAQNISQNILKLQSGQSLTPQELTNAVNDVVALTANDARRFLTILGVPPAPNASMSMMQNDLWLALRNKSQSIPQAAPTAPVTPTVHPSLANVFKSSSPVPAADQQEVLRIATAILNNQPITYADYTTFDDVVSGPMVGTEAEDLLKAFGQTARPGHRFKDLSDYVYQYFQNNPAAATPAPAAAAPTPPVTPPATPATPSTPLSTSPAGKGVPAPYDTGLTAFPLDSARLLSMANGIPISDTDLDDVDTTLDALVMDELKATSKWLGGPDTSGYWLASSLRRDLKAYIREQNDEVRKQQTVATPAPAAAPPQPSAPSKPPGVPPRPGLVWNPNTHRWIRPGVYEPPEPNMAAVDKAAPYKGSGSSANQATPATIDHTVVSSFPKTPSSLSADFQVTSTIPGGAAMRLYKHTPSGYSVVATWTGGSPPAPGQDGMYEIKVFDGGGKLVSKYDSQAARSESYIEERAVQVAHWTEKEVARLAAMKNKPAVTAPLAQFAWDHARAHSPQSGQVPFKIDDATWGDAANRKAVDGFLKSKFPKLVGAQQHTPHGGMDPVEHTMNIINPLNLRTSGLSDQDAKILRLGMTFHDVGKQYDPLDHDHPRKSATDAEPLLWQFGLTEREVHDTLAVIKWHDAYGDNMRSGSPKNVAKLAYEYTDDTLPPAQRAIEAKRISNLLMRAMQSDVSSIPGITADPIPGRPDLTPTGSIHVDTEGPAFEKKVAKEIDAMTHPPASLPLPKKPDNVTVGAEAPYLVAPGCEWGELVQRTENLPIGAQVPYNSTITPPKEVYDEAVKHPDLNFARAFNMAYDGPTGQITTVFHGIDKGGKATAAAILNTGMRPGNTNAFGHGVYTFLNGINEMDPHYSANEIVVLEVHTGRVVDHGELERNLLPAWRKANPADARRLSNTGLGEAAEKAAAALWAGYSSISMKYYGDEPAIVIVDPARIRIKSVVDGRKGKGTSIKTNNGTVKSADLTKDEITIPKSSSEYVPVNHHKVPQTWKGQPRTS